MLFMFYLLLNNNNTSLINYLLCVTNITQKQFIQNKYDFFLFYKDFCNLDYFETNMNKIANNTEFRKHLIKNLDNDEIELIAEITQLIYKFHSFNDVDMYKSFLEDVEMQKFHSYSNSNEKDKKEEIEEEKIEIAQLPKIEVKIEKKEKIEKKINKKTKTFEMSF